MFFYFFFNILKILTNVQKFINLDWELAEGDVGEGEADTDTDGDLSEGGTSATQPEPVDFYRLSDFTEGNFILCLY